MVGPWPLSPHHDHLQYIHHVHLMQRGQNWGVTPTHTQHKESIPSLLPSPSVHAFPSPFNSTGLSALQNLNKMLHWYHLSDLQN